MTDLATTLAGLSEEDLDRFFYESDAELIVKLVAATDDCDLERLLADRAVRAAAVGSVLARLDEYAVEERLASVNGTVVFCLRLPKRGEEVYALAFRDSGVNVVPPDGLDCDVTITCRMLDFVRMVTGGTNAADGAIVAIRGVRGRDERPFRDRHHPFLEYPDARDAS